MRANSRREVHTVLRPPIIVLDRHGLKEGRLGRLVRSKVSKGSAGLLAGLNELQGCVLGALRSGDGIIDPIVVDMRSVLGLIPSSSCSSSSSCSCSAGTKGPQVPPSLSSGSGEERSAVVSGGI